MRAWPRRWSWSGLDKFAGALPRALSGGMQMRVSIARGLVDAARPAADGRALRRARRDHAPQARRRPARAVAQEEAHGDLRDALDPRGGVPVEPRGDDGRAAGPRGGAVPHRRALSAQRPTSWCRRSSARYAKQLQDSLLRASSADEETEPMSAVMPRTRPAVRVPLPEAAARAARALSGAGRRRAGRDLARAGHRRWSCRPTWCPRPT